MVAVFRETERGSSAAMVLKRPCNKQTVGASRSSLVQKIALTFFTVVVAAGALALLPVGCYCLLVIYLTISMAPLPTLTPATLLLPIHVAAQNNDAAAITRLLQAGISVDLPVSGNDRWPDGSTPLMIAAQLGNLEATEALLQGGAALTLTDAHSETVVHKASGAALTLILGKAPTLDVNARAYYGQTPLMRAAMQARPGKDMKRLRALVRAGARVNLRDDGRNTAIELARGFPDTHPDVLEFLEQAAARQKRSPQ